MRLQMILPRVEPSEIFQPEVCPQDGCEGNYFRLHQKVEKPLRDTVYAEVTAYRYECLRCKRTFRVYPTGVSRASTSLRVKGLAVMLYLLGLSYGAVSLVLEALGSYLCKSQVYEAVQTTAKQVPGMKQEQVFEGIRTPAMGADLTSVRCNGEWLKLGLTVDDTSGLVLTIDDLEEEDAETLKGWIAPIAEAVGAEVLVNDDADAFKQVADELGMAQQVCKSHVGRNTERLVENLKPLAAQDTDGSLAEIDVSPEHAVEDLERLEELIHERHPEDQDELERLHLRYVDAPPPQKGAHASVAYRLRLLFLDRWNLWPRLTRYRTWQGSQGETIDGTNNGSERAIGWWVKERYRTMRGYKRRQSAINISRLLAFCGNHLDRGGLNLAGLMA